MRIESLYLFPVKSCAGISVKQFTCSPTGALFDREWMVVNAELRFVTQRELPRMALVKTSLGENSLVLSAEGKKPLEVFFSSAGKISPMEIWGQIAEAKDEGDEAAAWLSDFLGQPLRLARSLAGKRSRQLGEEHQRELRFTDDYPLNIASLSSLADLNGKLGQQLEMLRFRPNIVVSGAEPWEEDRWASLRIGPHVLRVGKACTRCTITTVDPATAEKGAEPLKTLATFRKNEKNKIEFGIHLHSAPGAQFKVGMEVSAEKK